MTTHEEDELYSFQIFDIMGNFNDTKKIEKENLYRVRYNPKL